MINKNKAGYLKGLIATYAYALAEYYYKSEQGYDRAYRDKVKSEMEKAKLDNYIARLTELKS